MLRAGRAGRPAARALAGATRGRVASVHHRAVILRLAAGSVVTLLPDGAPIHPWALTAPVDPAALGPGDAVQAATGALDIGPLRIDLASAQVIDLSLRARPAALPAGAASALAHLAPAAAGAERDDPCEAALRATLARFQAGAPAEDLASLVGLGPGLTPSGDDVLVGILAGLDLAASAHASVASRRAAIAALCVERAPGRTTALSAQLLTAAVAGLYAEPLLYLLTALATPGSTSTSPPSLTRAAAPLLAMGHRSGADIVRGLAAALAWLRYPNGGGRTACGW